MSHGKDNLILVLDSKKLLITSFHSCPVINFSSTDYLIAKEVTLNDVGINILRPRQNGCHLQDNIFRCIVLNENVWILIKTSLKFVPKGPINNIPSLVHIMAWCRPGDRTLSWPIMVNLLMHIRPQWVKLSFNEFKHINLLKMVNNQKKATHNKTMCIILGIYHTFNVKYKVVLQCTQLLLWGIHRSNLLIFFRVASLALRYKLYLNPTQQNQGLLWITWINLNPSMDK